MRVAIIPARKGSARVPGKNTAIVAGISLIERAIKQAIRTDLYDKIIVSSDDPVVWSTCLEYPVTIDERAPELADPHSPLIAVLAYTIHKYNIPLDATVALLQVTNPLRTDEDIRKAHNIFESSSRHNTLVSVCELEYPVELTWNIDKKNMLFSRFEAHTTRKQDFPPSYRYNDAIVIDMATNFISEDRKLFGASPLPFQMPPERSFCIDYPWQFEIIRMLIEVGA